MKKNKIKIGEILVHEGIITKEQLRIALIEQRYNRSGKLGEVLLNLNFINEKQHQAIVSMIGGHKTVDLDNVTPDIEAIRLIGESFAKMHNVLPINFENGVLQVACPNPDDLPLMEKIKRQGAGQILEVRALSSTADKIREAINIFYGLNQDVSRMLDEISEIDSEDGNDELDEAIAHPYIRLANAILMEAFRLDASDIHLTPKKYFGVISYRIDGVMQEMHMVHRKDWPHLISRLKIEAGMDISEKRRPQDGRIEKKIGRKLISYRASTLPVAYGENLVLRVLDQSKAIVSMEQLGLDAHDLKTLKLMVSKPVGILLVTGPTGSGKTTTLYSMLNEANDGKTNIMTLEDPIEYMMDGVRQSQINEKIGLNFGEGIRTLMRQDPDRILIGEIRDEETAIMAMRAAITGHQVFATLHANSAIGAFPRLIDMGVDKNVLAGNVIGAISQRLVRKLCPHCKVEYKPDDFEKSMLGLNENDDVTLYKESENGCEHCHHTGFKGRIAVMEALRFNHALDEEVLAGSSWRDIEQKAKTETGFRSMMEAARSKIIHGETSLNEALRVIDFSEVL